MYIEHKYYKLIFLFRQYGNLDKFSMNFCLENG